jgi:hypothetical protein
MICRAPKYPIGTTFRKKWVGYGVWEGCIASFDGEDYEVKYVEDNFIEFISEDEMEDIISRSNKYDDVKLQTRENQQLGQHNDDLPCGEKRNRSPTERYTPPPVKKERRQTTVDTSSMKVEKQPPTQQLSFLVGQQVWVVVGRTMHSAVIKTILNPNMVKVQWSTLLTYSNVSVDDIKPMFDTTDGGEVISSEFSKRKRQKTNKYTPPPLQPRFTKKERNDDMTSSHKVPSLKKEYSSPKQCGKKKKCSVEGCKNLLLAKGKCRQHYNQDWWLKAKKEDAKKHKKSSFVKSKKQYSVTKKEPRKSDEELRLEKEKDEEYKALWDMYLEPVVRKNEELPSGMHIRQKRAVCSLLRCKMSKFRKKLHAEIHRLDREGNKGEILQMLKQMREHDESGAVGDGPPDLLKRILDVFENDDVAIVDFPATSSQRVKKERVFDLEEQPTSDTIVANTAFTPIASDIMPSEAREEKKSSQPVDAKMQQDKVIDLDQDHDQDEDSSEKEAEDDSSPKDLSIAEVENTGNEASVTPAENKRGVCSPSIAKSLDKLESRMLQPVETKIYQDKPSDHDQDEDPPNEEVEDDFNPKDMTDGEANVTPAETKRGVCSPSVAKSLDKLESKKLQRTGDSSTVSSLGYGDPLEYKSTKIPTEIIIRRRFHTCSLSQEDSAMSINEISDDAGGTSSTNDASSNCVDHKQSSNNAAHATGEDGCIDLCDSIDDQTVSYHGEKEQPGQVEIIDVDAPKEQQITSRKLSAMNEVTVLY